MCSGLCHTQHNALNFFQDNSFQGRCMMRERHYEEPNGTKTTILPAILKPKFALANNNCIVPP
jgi:hypothetical protein